MGRTLPSATQVFLLAMLLEEHKEVMRLRQALDDHVARQP